MKFYTDYVNKFFNYWAITDNNLTAIHQCYSVTFFKNGVSHNSKNAAIISKTRYKEFRLNGKHYGFECNFTKKIMAKICKRNNFKAFFITKK
jgi:hypothetical protein